MASTNPFDLLGDNESDDLTQLIAAKAASNKSVAPTQVTAQKPQQQKPSQAKMPSKPLPPAQAVRVTKNEGVGGRGGGRSGGRGLGRGRDPGGFKRDYANNENAFNNGVPLGTGAVEDGDVRRPSERGRGSYGGPRGPFRGGHRGSFNNGELGDVDRPRRQFDRRSGSGQGSEMKREGAGRGNWGTATDDGFTEEKEEPVDVNDKNSRPEKQPGVEDVALDSKENPVNEPEEKEPEDKEMTLEEYEKVLEEKRKALQALKSQERKVDVDKDFKSMQQLSSKKNNDDVFIKLGSEKDKRKEILDKEEKVKKSVTINEFLKPAEGGKYYSPGGRGRGRGRGRGSGGGFAGGNMTSNVTAPSIEDPGHFPSLGAK